MSLHGLSLLLLIGCCIGQQVLNNTALDLTFPQGFDYESLTWAGALGGRRGDGCSASRLPGALELACLLPAGGVTLTVDRAGNELTLRCEDETYTCQELQEARANVSQYVQSALNRTIQKLTIDNCILPEEPLTCVLEVAGARDSALLVLRHLRTDLTERHLQGLEAVHSIWMRDLASNITSVPYDALATLPTLRRLTIMSGSVSLASPPGPTLGALAALEVVDGHVAVVHAGVFRRTPAVQSLMLVGSKIREIEEHAFDDLPLLVNVSLESNLLSSLPPALFSRTPLVQNIDLYNNELRALDATVFRDLTHLTEVNLFGNKEPLHLEGGVFSELASLRSVDLHNTDLPSLPPDVFANSRNIRNINLSDTKLATLHELVFFNLSLETLDLSHNVIEELSPKMLQGAKSLVSLDLDYNKLKVLPVGLFDSLRSLKILHVNNNDIEYLDDNIFQGLGNLEHLYLNSNKLRTLSSRTFELVPNLQVVSLSHNQLSFPPPPSPAGQQLELFSPLAGLKRLLRLELDHNRLEVLCDDWRYLVFLQDLDLSSNFITELNNLDFLGKVRVDVRHNNVTSVRLRPTSPDESPDQLPDVWLDYNPYRCDCSLYSFITLRRDPANIGRLHIDDARCAEPPELARTRLADLTPDMLTCESSPCPTACRCLARPATRRAELDCNTFPDFFPDVSDYTNGMVLKLNNFTRLDPLPDYVKLLNISGLNITEAPHLSSNSSILVDLRDNFLTTAPRQLLQQNCSLYLARNPFSCGCEDTDSILTLKQHETNIIDYPHLTCDNGDFLHTKDTAHLCAMRHAVTVSTIALTLAALVVVLVVVGYRHIVVIRIVLRKVGLSLADEGLGDHEYDAFVSYAHQDEPLVVKLVRDLESGSPPLRLCTHTRDWVPGELIAEQIARSVERSRRTVIVLSEHFVKSSWARLEFLTAHSKNRVVLLIVDDIHLSDALSADIKSYIKLTTYIHISNPYAVERLRDAVLVKSKWGGLLKVGGGEGGKWGRGALDVQVNVDGKLVNNAQAQV